jgi:hypothetical protein
VTDEVWATVAKTKKKDKVKVDCFNNGTYQTNGLEMLL